MKRTPKANLIMLCLCAGFLIGEFFGIWVGYRMVHLSASVATGRQ
jgi:hypothetical protein